MGNVYIFDRVGVDAGRFHSIPVEIQNYPAWLGIKVRAPLLKFSILAQIDWLIVV